VWSLGVILYVLVCGKVPFDDKSLAILHEKIKTGYVEYPTFLSTECESLLRSVLVVDPKKRADVAFLLKHPWMVKEGPINTYVPERTPLDSLNEDVMNELYSEFEFQHPKEYIRNILETSLDDWDYFSSHPLIKMYYLIREKQKRGMASSGRSSVSMGRRSLSSSFKSLSVSMPGKILQGFQRPRGNTLPDKPATIAVDPNVNLALPSPDATLHRNKLSLSSIFNRLRHSTSATNDDKVEVRNRSNTAKQGKSAVSDKVLPRSRTTGTGFKDNGRGPTIPQESETPEEEPWPSQSPIITENFAKAFSVDDPAAKEVKVEDEEYKCKSVYIKGLFSFSTTTAKPVHEIRKCLIETLKQNHIDFIEKPFIGTVSCEHHPSITVDAPPEKDADRVIRFEISIVRLTWLNLHGIQFRRLSGDAWVYKSLCSQLISGMKL
jgi:hypothetical protein